ncbi:hypothetical protein CA265_04790 [Sphingobacteriaceae bacterium GW460-11-11-14-LB5]|nr:hypothetical protein CA265_04790 [Sphingobacteriaceae bacterium GW460-11-11-14-LB5]
MVLCRAKVPKALCQSNNGPFTQSHTHQKTVALRFVFNVPKNFKLAFMNTKPLRLRFVNAMFTIEHLFFDFSGPWD